MNLIYFALYLMSYFILHSFLAHKKVKKILIGPMISSKYYRLIYNFLAIILLIPSLFLYQQIESNFLFDLPSFKIIGLILLPLGSILLIWTLSQYNLSEFIGTEQLREQKENHQVSLKTSGFNSIVRHPLYFSTLLILWGLFLFRPTDLILMIASIATMYLYFGTKLEEEKLVEEFKDEYKVYQKEVPMLLPWKGVKKG